MLELQTRNTVLEHPKAILLQNALPLTMDNKNDHQRPCLVPTGTGYSKTHFRTLAEGEEEPAPRMIHHHDYRKHQVVLVSETTITNTTLPAHNDVSYATKKQQNLYSSDLHQEKNDDHGDDARGGPRPYGLPSGRPPAPQRSATEASLKRIEGRTSLMIPLSVSSSNHDHPRIISTGSTTSGANHRHHQHHPNDGTSTHLEIESEDPVAIPPPQPGCAFPFHLHHMLNDAERVGFQHVVSWLKDARSFKVHDKEKFERDILFQYFRGQTHYKSFQRQRKYYPTIRNDA